MMETGRQSLVRWCGLLVMIAGLQTVAGFLDDFSFIPEEFMFSMSSCQDMDGGWGAWGPWGDCCCDRTRTMLRERSCNSPEPSGKGESCSGSVTEMKSCAAQCEELPCWDAWSEWGTCDCSAGANATKTRERQCSTSDTTQNDCYGHGKTEVDTKICAVECEAPVWAAWGPYSRCNSTGEMMEYRVRVCIIPDGSTLTCDGINEEKRPCVFVNGEWGAWQEWGDCLCDTEGNGKRYRGRWCDNPAPSAGGGYCTGQGKESQDCDACVTTTPFAPTPTMASGRRLLAHEKEVSENELYVNRKLLWDDDNCPANGGWSEWEPWGKCKCGGNMGTTTRKRNCDNPVPTACAKDCEGSNFEMAQCFATECRDNTAMCQFCKYTTNTGYYRNPTDCRNFFMCEKIGSTGKRKNKKYTYKATSQYCPKGTVFSEASLACDRPGMLDADEKCYEADPCSNADIKVEEDPFSCAAYICWPEPTLPFRHCCDPFHSFSIHERRCVPDKDCLPASNCANSEDPNKGLGLMADDSFNIVEGCVQNGVNYKRAKNKNKYIVVSTNELRECPLGRSGKRMQFNDAADRCSCFDVGPAIKTCKDEEYLVAYFPFDADFNDHSCNRLSGVQSGTVSIIARCRDGGGCAKFTKGRFDIPYFNNWFGTGRPEFSLALWMFLDGTSNNDQGVVHNGNCHQNPSVQIEIRDGKLFTQMNGQEGVTSNTQLVNNWNHVVMTFDLGQVTLYINGEQSLQYQILGSTTVIDTNCLMMFGQLKNGGFLKGRLDEILIYETTLNRREVKKIYDQDAPKWYKK